MPKGTRVERAYQHLRSKGASKAKAARIAQWSTGRSLATGQRPKSRRKLSR